MKRSTALKGSCECGAVTLEAKASPPARFFCHCTVCQTLYRAPFADITALWRWNVHITKGEDQLDYRRLVWFPASVRRGMSGTSSITAASKTSTTTSPRCPAS